MTEITIGRLQRKLEALKNKNTLEVLNNYLKRAKVENLNIAPLGSYLHGRGEIKAKTNL